MEAKKLYIKTDLYFLMTRLAINTKEMYIADYFIDRLECEESTTVLSACSVIFIHYLKQVVQIKLFLTYIIKIVEFVILLSSL